MKFYLMAFISSLLLTIVSTASTEDSTSTVSPTIETTSDDGVTGVSDTDSDNSNSERSDDESPSESGSRNSNNDDKTGSNSEDSSDSDDNSDLPEPDNPNGLSAFDNGDQVPIPGNWGINCPIMKSLCTADLYRTIMQRACRSSCRPETCLDRRPDLCKGWAKNNFCTSTFYKNLRESCSRTCSICTSST